MYQEEFKRWLAADLEDPDLKPELSMIYRACKISRGEPYHK